MAMTLSPRDAIAISDIERYDSFMAEVADSQFLDMYFDNTGVKIDVYEYPSNALVRSAHFEPSPKADYYFKQQKAHADEILGDQAEEGMTEREIICKRDEYMEESNSLSTLEKRRSRCRQFCGNTQVRYCCNCGKNDVD
ncbi:hypothetical protein FSPOR_8361 [Fusarium sporotrichioides]|uniref:Uncharacterized protein n=1 Tax=Fusarium sporotrichioides TaxID=5514 RepID=A0A395RUT6_FUSSP|nr:hypothetical protein FSPOR_8361 [Fusarium sporotrichioides]